jgi:hypothetical protein
MAPIPRCYFEFLPILKILTWTAGRKNEPRARVMAAAVVPRVRKRHVSGTQQSILG